MKRMKSASTQTSRRRTREATRVRLSARGGATRSTSARSTQAESGTVKMRGV